MEPDAAKARKNGYAHPDGVHLGDLDPASIVATQEWMVGAKLFKWTAKVPQGCLTAAQQQAIRQPLWRSPVTPSLPMFSTAAYTIDAPVDIDGTKPIIDRGGTHGYRRIHQLALIAEACLSKESRFNSMSSGTVMA